MRRIYLLPMLVLLAGPLAGQGDPDHAVAGGGALPAGWSARTDAGQPLDNVKFVTMGPGLHVTLGPATIFYRDADNATGNYHVVATFTRTKAPGHREAYGLFLAGKDLKGEGITYTYFLVGASGEYLVKRKTGPGTRDTENISAGWVKDAAAATADADGKATDKLEILVQNGKATFSVNGKAVQTAEGNFDGIVGLRVNHNLDLHIAGFGMHKM